MVGKNIRFNGVSLREIKAVNFIHVNPLPVWAWLICDVRRYSDCIHV